MQSWGKCFFLKISSVTNYYQLHTCQKVNGEQFILVKKWYYSINFICVFDHLVYFGKHFWSIFSTNCLAIVCVLLTQNMQHIFSQMILTIFFYKLVLKYFDRSIKSIVIHLSTIYETMIFTANTKPHFKHILPPVLLYKIIFLSLNYPFVCIYVWDTR